eukprot:CAMPEP_0202375136 /NCGR_PEP_ID=MMETSP1127-20130417/5845_1 /ASSEMBLY_ACC=CAM_ASM_000462 /TAXON_ID=3047 /ORGANISM="Dunaliella tertiolecta, Strain CCMP1320" /LENGTH=128 /DNA_ID=CAMNT_0048972507 /DNA_START=1334 /DNA_END=1717 /DNA_ORIENTATION=+
MEHLDDGLDMFAGLDDQLPSAPPIPQQKAAIDPFLLAADEQTWDLADWDWDPVNCVARRKGEGNTAQPSSNGGPNTPMEGLQLPNYPTQEGSAGGDGPLPSHCHFQPTQADQSSLPTTTGALDWTALP